MGRWLKVNGEAIYGAGPTPFGPELGHPDPTKPDQKTGAPTFVASTDWRCTTKPGKLYIHLSTQSVVQTVMSVVRWLSLEPENVVVISEYCGGGYGSKGTGSVTDIIPALLAKKTGTP